MEISKDRFTLRNLFIPVIPLLLAACAFNPKPSAAFPESTKYSTAPPQVDITPQLDRALKSVKKISTIAYYTTYYFAPEQKIISNQVPTLDLEAESIDQGFFNESSSGTATILQYDFNRIAVLTCAHVGNYSDTILTHFDSEELQSLLASVSVKTRSEFFVNEIPGGDKLKLLAEDKSTDLALYGRQYAAPRKRELSNFPYQLGNDRDMNWGVFVYLAGFPMGIKTVSTGIVSQPRGIRKGTFMIDANFNPGFSGGVVLSLRSGSNTFEWVGLVKSVSATTYYYLKPDVQNIKEPNRLKPYEGPIYLERVSDINYGITYAISAETIRTFLKQNESRLLAKGFDLTYFTD